MRVDISLPDGRKVDGKSGGVKTEDEGVTVTPKPGFVVKTSRADGKGDSKVFINVCTSAHLKPPAKKKQLDEEGKEQEVGWMRWHWLATLRSNGAM